MTMVSSAGKIALASAVFVIVGLLVLDIVVWGELSGMDMPAGS
jgi:hypothetical protein